MNSFEEDKKQAKKKDVSIHPNRRNPKRLEIRKANHIRNRSIRAELYAEHRSNEWNKNVSVWHDTLKALSVGSASR